jgi:DNA repair protein RecO (recombination protein O)
MSRTQCYSALILRNRSSGEANRDVWLLTAGAGVLRATVFGGPKSRLRAHTAPFHSGQVWIYHDPVRDSRKISDFDVRAWRPGLRELYERAMAADAVAETILASHGGGGHWEAALALAESSLDALEGAAEECCGRLLTHFLWQWAGFLGLRPELDRCASCAASAAPDSPLWYSPREGGVLCAACAGPAAGPGGLLPLSPGCRRWLAAVGPLPAPRIERYTMDSQSFREARALAAAIIAEALGKRPASWEW